MSPKVRKIATPDPVPDEADCYLVGECSVIVAREGEEDRWHISIAHPRRYPTWEEISFVRRRFVPDEPDMAMPLPGESRWLNLHENCFHLWELSDEWLREELRRSGEGMKVRL